MKNPYDLRSEEIKLWVSRQIGTHISLSILGQRHKDSIDVYAKMRLYNGYLLSHSAYCLAKAQFR